MASFHAGAALVEGSSSSAFGVKAHVVLFGQGGLNFPATPHVAAPDADAEHPDDVSNTIVGPIRIPPDTGQLIADLRALHVSAKRTSGDSPTAHAESQIAHVALFEQDGEPQIEADVLHAVADVKCTAANKATASADGSRFASLSLGGNEIDATPSPNTEVPLVYTGDPDNPADDMGIRVILNEQTGADAGNGIIVTMLHVIAFSPTTPNIIFADVRIASAKATAFCGNDSPPTNGNEGRDLSSDKTVTSTTSDPQGALDVSGVATAFRGDEVTWTITITNSGEGCSIINVVDTLPAHFTFKSTKGDLSDGATAVVDGQTVTWTNNARWPLAPGAKIVETLTATVADDAPFGTYTDLVDIDESTCSTFTQGNRGPVDVIPRPAAVKPRVLGRTATLPGTGVNAAAPIAIGLMLIGLGMAARVASRRTI
jgi:fimbrial isopeptide formation D2 family protein